MKAVDTNVLVRAFQVDDPVAAAIAQKALANADRLYISTATLCELVWVLRSTYGRRRQDVAGILEELIESEGVVMERGQARAGLDMLERGGDFADGVILHDALLAGADPVLTFDRNFARLALPEVELLS